MPCDSGATSSISTSPRSSAASPRVIGPATSASRRMGAISISMAVM
ncbi:Uncharacterised protein [Mycobacterium tuberculosis]|nr:Uncharacterised protein [Mycobacterium tuberculosis]